MALLRFDHVPETTKVTMPLYVILPDPGKIGDLPVRERKVLYLLHGLSGDATSWQRYSAIETLAEAYRLVVVMPTAGRSFYADLPNGQRYFTYLTEELPAYMYALFGLRPRREDTLIAGLSMGGYGAFKAAFAYPERFFAAASLSGVLGMGILDSDPDDARRAEFEHLFGDLSKLPGSSHDPAAWLERERARGSVLPRLYIACGLQDELYPLSSLFAKACGAAGYDVAYREGEGGHDWLFWDFWIRDFLSYALGPVPR
ncbi:MAG: alpha/beta hydrolase family protein [Spirochaetaceae bacterium]|nr:alpha/beta hydrolase family protein [Spirochaetaceae bacterium]